MKKSKDKNLNYCSTDDEFSFNIKSKIYGLIERKQKITVIAASVVFIIIVSFFTPVYNVRTIEVDGNASVNTETILKASGIYKGLNMFKVNLKRAKQQISSVAYIDSVKIKRLPPSKIKITVSESVECVYISFLGSFVGTDKRGKILEIKQSYSQLNRPVVKGISLKSFEIGSKAEFSNAETEKLLYSVAGYIEKEGLGEDVKVINLKDSDNISFELANGMKAQLGNSDNLKYKIAYLKAALAEMDGVTGGVIELSDTENVTYRGGQ